MSSLHCTLSTPDGVVFRGEAWSVIVPAVDGELGILPRHAPLILQLGWGEMRVRPPGGAAGVTSFFLDGGFVQVLEGHVNVLAVKVESLEKLPKADAEARLASLVESRPDPFAPFEEREAHEEKIRAAKELVKLARGG